MTGGPVLVVAAHPDDEVLGCGGTIAKLRASRRDVHVLILADGESSRTGLTSAAAADSIADRTSAAQRACAVLDCSSLEVLRLPDNRLDDIDLLDVVRIVEERIRTVAPTTVFTHHVGDVNVDHRIVHEAVLAASRPQLGCPVKELYFFEVPSSTEWRPPQSGTPFVPSLWVDISAVIGIKRKALECYAKELRPFPHPRSIEAVEALATWRGATVGASAAEAFIVGRQII